MIAKCENLRHLAWNETFYSRRSAESWRSAMEYFAKNNIRKLGVKSLELKNFSVGWLAKDFIQQMLYIFPNIKRLEFDLLHLYITSEQYDFQDLFATIGKTLGQLQDQLIEFHMPNTRINNGNVLLNEIINMKRLAKLTVELIGPWPDHEWFCKGIMQLKNLNSLAIYVWDMEWHSIGILTSLIQFLPHLRHLEYAVPDLTIYEEIFHCFQHSQLVTLSLGANASKLGCDECTIQTDTSARNHNLRKLSFTSDLDQHILPLFTKYFSNLQQLILRSNLYTCAEDDNMFELSMYQTKLRSLENAYINPNDTKWKEIVKNIGSPRSFTFQHEKLEALLLYIYWDKTTCIKDNILDVFDFPKLKFLAVESKLHDMNDDILGAIANFSNLQILTTHMTQFSFEAISEMCSKLKRLRQLHIPVADFDEKKAKKLFQVCLSLEAFRNGTERIYIKDQSNNIYTHFTWEAPTRFYSLIKVGNHTF